MSRKDTLKAILSGRGGKLPPGNSSTDENQNARQEPMALTHVRSGAVGAMGRSLGQIAQAAEHARALIASGQTVIEIDPGDLDNSFVSDRMATEGPDFDVLVEAIKESGQRSPILVRPHPEKTGRYQIAFGHRRARAAEKLGRSVKAVVQELSDEEFVVIQGQENSARTDLSYIERGLFAAELERRGFDRRIIMTSLGMEKTQLSKLLALIHSIPKEVVVAIGPAPKAGRPRWSALAERLGTVGQAKVTALICKPEFKSLDTDNRFAALYNGLASPATALKPTEWKVGDKKIASIERSGSKVSIVVDEKVAPKFGEFIASQLPELHRQFQLRESPRERECSEQ